MSVKEILHEIESLPVDERWEVLDGVRRLLEPVLEKLDTGGLQGPLAGAARLLVESGETPQSLREAVTSPGGTTEAGLRVLEDRGVRVAITAAVAAATQRSRQLAR